MMLRKLLKPFKPWLKVALLGVVCGHIFLWRGESVRMVQIELKHLTGVAGISDYLKAGYICIALGEYELAVKSFEHVIKMDPRHGRARASLALALSHLSRYGESLRHYREYFELGGQAPDVMHGYGLSLMNARNWDKALNWLYRAVRMAPQQTRYAADLVDSLMVLGRQEEALAVIGALTFGRPEQHPFWFAKLEAIASQQTGKLSVRGPDGRRLIRLPALYRDQFYLPVIAGGGAGYSYFLLDRDYDKNQWSEDERERGPANVAPKTLKVGPWSVENLVFENCRRCESRLGDPFLRNFEVNYYREEGVEFMELAPGSRGESGVER